MKHRRQHPSRPDLSDSGTCSNSDHSDSPGSSPSGRSARRRISSLSTASSICLEEEEEESENFEPEYVEVNAPATLSEGYVFMATLRNDTLFPVRVPHGGVESGQTLRVPLWSASERGESGVEHSHDPGRWKDGLCSCFRLGLCHPHLCNAWLCPQILLGQVLVRMKMTGLGHRLHWHSGDVDANDNKNKASTPQQSSSSSVQSAFRKLMILVVLLTLYDALVAPPLFELQLDEETGKLTLASRWYSASDFPVWHQLLYLLLSLPMTVWGIMVVVRLRVAIRQRYNIPTGRLGRWEDMVCVCCCNCCVMSQMARQTADYDGEEPASCCSPSGIRIRNKKEDAVAETSDREKDDDTTSFTRSLSVPSSPSSLTSSFTISRESFGSGSPRSRKLVERSILLHLQDNPRPCMMATVV